MRKNKMLFYISCICYFFSSITVFLLPYSREPDAANLTGTGYLMGVLFWLGIILGTAIHYINWRLVRNSGKYLKSLKKRIPGVFGFFRTTYGIAADILLFAAVVLMVLSMSIRSIPDAVIIFDMCLFIFSFSMHFLLNGKVYRYIFSKDKGKERKKSYEEI